MSHLNTVKSSKPFDDDLPEARYKSLEEAILKLKEWAKNRVGGFDMVVGTKQRGKAFSGDFNRVELRCSRHGTHYTSSKGYRTSSTKKCNCPWKLSIVQRKFDDGVFWCRAYMHEWPRGVPYNNKDTHGGTHPLNGKSIFYSKLLSYYL